jgi:hypothetical protein
MYLVCIVYVLSMTTCVYFAMLVHVLCVEIASRMLTSEPVSRHSNQTSVLFKLPYVVQNGLFSQVLVSSKDAALSLSCIHTCD